MTKEQAMATSYDPRQVEGKWYQDWLDKNYFRAEVEPDREPFTIVMPPPNVTGSLHLGHALDNAMQDILTRFKRMQGYNALWVPGTDHAGIATQAKVEEQLASEGLSKYDLGREKFLERVWDWKHQYGNRITNQLKTLGASCDWSRERFTMDEGCSRAVQEVFVELYNRGLIYRGDYIINWCPKCQTTISDIEVEHEDKLGHLWFLKYPIKDQDRFITVATTRPETMLGDTAVAVHPEDDRYQDLIGRTVVLPLMNREIPIIADPFVEKEFGTGAVKVTPAHDPDDFEMGLRHRLPQLVVIDKKGRMNDNAGAYAGLDRYECRKQVVADLEKLGLLVKVEEHQHAVGQCYRCDTVVERLVSKQWFVKMKPLAEPAMEVVRQGRTQFVPERFTKIYLGWLENIRDWCISRQLWWGHRIPVWYCQDCGEIICTKDEPSRCNKCEGEHLEQDPDVLDTWFSSGLWPFSTLGWPEETPELKHFYPTSVLVTGRDIIFFWVARMIFMALAFMDDVPFRKVLIHGLILDAQGRKMSKSLGNGVDPIEVIDQYGADTLRFMLVTGNTPGSDVRFHMERLDQTRNFANKIWNAARFVLMNLADFEPNKQPAEPALADKWILSRYHQTVVRVTRYLEDFELGEAAQTLYEFIWNEYCDWYIELVKPRLYGRESAESKAAAQHVLHQVLLGTMKLLHPFMPYITEEIYQHLPHQEDSVMLSVWPKVEEQLINQAVEAEMSLIMETIRAIRNLRAELNLPPGRQVEVILVAEDADLYQVLEAGRPYLMSMANAGQVEVHRGLATKPAQAVTALVGRVEIYLPLEGLIDLNKEIERLQKEVAGLDLELARVSSKLSNEGFIAKAPAAVIEKEKEKRQEYQAKKDALLARLAMLRK